MQTNTKKQIVKKILGFVLAFIIAFELLTLQNISKANSSSSLYLDKVKYNIQVNNDGSMNVSPNEIVILALPARFIVNSGGVTVISFPLLSVVLESEYVVFTTNVVAELTFNTVYSLSCVNPKNVNVPVDVFL